MSSKSAAVIALELYNEPRLARRFASASLPDGVLSLIKIAAGDEAEYLVFPSHIASDPVKARAISVFYLQQVLFHPTSHGHRLLGLPLTATPDQFREHKRWLLKWLHPDRNQNKWEQLYFRRVMDAVQHWNDRDINGQGAQGKQPASTELQSRKSSPRLEKVRLPKMRPQPKLNILSRVVVRVKQVAAGLAVVAAVFWIFRNFELASGLSRSIPDFASLFH